MHSKNWKMHCRSLLLISLLACGSFTKANTEIINFEASYSDNVALVEAVNWYVAFHNSSLPT